MKHSLKKQLLSMLLALVLVFGMLPLTALATAAEPKILADTGIAWPNTMPLVSSKKSTLAPGVTQFDVVSYSSDGNRVEIYVTETDLSVDTVQIFANYYNNQNIELGMQKTTVQAAKFEEKHPGMQVVAAINASYYNMGNGKPNGAFIMEGVDMTSNGNSYPFFAIMKDGTAMIGAAGQYSTYKDQIKEAIGGHIHLIKNGQIVGGLDRTDKMPRQTIGITAEGKIITMTADGRQAPMTDGTTVQEQAEIMLALGCVEALHLDGGGSCTYAAKPEGEDSLRVVSSPSDGSERAVSNSLVIVSTAAASNAFDHATLKAEHDYIAPGVSVNITVDGVSSTGHNAVVPADAKLQVKDAAMGAIVDGKFAAAADFTGDAVIQLVYGGKVVGETAVHVVIPTALNFKNNKIVVSYGKTVALDLIPSVNNGLNEVVVNEDNIVFTVSDAKLGSVSGFDFTAGAMADGVSFGIITAKLASNENVSAVLHVELTNLPDAPVMIEDFEDQPVYRVAYSAGSEQTWGVVDATTGKVHSGNYAYKLGGLSDAPNDHMPENVYCHLIHFACAKNAKTGGYTQLVDGPDLSGVSLVNAQKIGMWVYLPEDSHQSYISLRLHNPTSVTTSAVNFYNYGYTSLEEGHTGWNYFEVDVTPYNDGNFYIERITISTTTRNDQYYGYDKQHYQSLAGYHEWYIDDITIEYLDFDIDREDPNFESITMTHGGVSDITVNGQTITGNEVSFRTVVTDASALDAASATAYIDGNKIPVSYDNRVLTTETLTLADGTHTITFVISDIHGNCDYITRQIVVDADSDIPTVAFTPNANNAERPLCGALCWFDVTVDNIENVDTITMLLNLDVSSDWELDHMDVLKGFTAEYSINKATNDAIVTFTKTGKVDVTGNAQIAKIPVRMHRYEHAAISVSSGAYIPVDMRIRMEKGLVTYTDGTETTFSMANIDIDSELYNWLSFLPADYKNHVSHTHDAKPMADKPAGCYEDGYTGRTFCAVCNSVVNWGTTLKAAHKMGFVDGKLMCTVEGCGELYTGDYEGKTYIDGVSVGTGWTGNSYYIDGVRQTGIKDIDGVIYDLGEDGISKGKYSGLYEKDGELYFAIVGTPKSGWIYESGDYYYFDPATKAAVNGNKNIAGYSYEFVDKKLYNGHWINNADGTVEYVWAGRKLESEWFTLRGKTYFFDTYGKRATGTCLIKLNTGGDSQFFIFDDEGVLQTPVTSTGLFEYDGATYYVAKGIVKTGLQKDGEKYYYFRSNYQMYTGTYRFVDTKAANGLITEGYCYFDAEDHHLLNNEFADPDGDGVETYFVMGRIATGGQWVEENGKTYYVNDGNRIMGATWIDDVYYYFSEVDGHLYDNEFVDLDGTLYYMIKGQIQYLGLVEINGETYYISTNSGRVMVNCGYWVAADKNPTGKDQLYYFDENGCRRDKEFFELAGEKYYMVDGQPAKLGLFELDGELYYASTNSAAIKTGKYYVNAANANGHPGDCYYYFDEDGKALDKEFYIDGNGDKYYMINGQPCKDGLVEINGAYYYLSTNSGAAKCNVSYYVLEKNTNGLLAEGWYTFDADGKIVF